MTSEKETKEYKPPITVHWEFVTLKNLALRLEDILRRNRSATIVSVSPYWSWFYLRRTYFIVWY